MKPRISFITLGVSDLEKSVVFYRDGMGLPTEGIIGTEFEDGAVAFFKMNDNLLFGALSEALTRQGRQGAHRPAESFRVLHWAQRELKRRGRCRDETGTSGRSANRRSCT